MILNNTIKDIIKNKIQNFSKKMKIKCFECKKEISNKKFQNSSSKNK